MIDSLIGACVFIRLKTIIDASIPEQFSNENGETKSKPYEAKGEAKGSDSNGTTLRHVQRGVAAVCAIARKDLPSKPRQHSWLSVSSGGHP